MKKKLPKLVLCLLTLSFLISYIVYETGYYEYKLQNRMVLTKEQMEKFENDVNNGLDVTLNDYIIEENIDYTSNFTEFTAKINNKTSKYIKKSIELIFKKLNKLVSD